VFEYESGGVGVARTSVGVCSALSVEKAVASSLAVRTATIGVPIANPMIERLPSARSTSSFSEKMENWKLAPRGKAAPLQ